MIVIHTWTALAVALLAAALTDRWAVLSASGETPGTNRIAVERAAEARPAVVDMLSATDRVPTSL